MKGHDVNNGYNVQTPGLTVLDKLEHTIILALQLKFHGSRSQLTIFQGGSMGKEKDRHLWWNTL